MSNQITFASVMEGRLATYAMLSRLYRSEMDAAALAEMKKMKCPINTGNADVDTGYKLFHRYLSGAWERTLEDLQREMGLTYIFVAHDLSMVRHISHRIAVMYLGYIVEISPAEELYRRPLHPYTQALLSAIPIPNPRLAREQQRVHLAGDPPNPSAEIAGCPFAGRCPHCTAECRQQRPELREITQGHQAACHHIQGGQA